MRDVFPRSWYLETWFFQDTHPPEQACFQYLLFSQAEASSAQRAPHTLSPRSHRATKKSRSTCIINNKLSEDPGPQPGRGALCRTFNTVEDELSAGSQSSVSLILFSSLQKLVINHSDQEVTALPGGLPAQLQLKGKGSKVRRHGVEAPAHKR